MTNRCFGTPQVVGSPILHYGWVDVVVQRDLFGLVRKGHVVYTVSDDQGDSTVHLRWVDDTTLAVNRKLIDVSAKMP